MHCHRNGNGNRTGVQQRTNATDANPVASDTYNRTTGTNRLASIVSASGTRTIGYDARGNTSSASRPGNISVSTSYDGYGRLLTYNRTGSEAQTNAYNGLDDRVTVSAKFGTTKANTRTYVYDPDGRLLGEYGASAAAPLAETIWMQPEVANDNMFGGNDGTAGYAPLALVGGSGAAATLYWVHGSHLGVPLLTTNASGATATPTGYTAVGFPGQTRTLADLYYNRYRDYDTTTGRYIQADPIG
ncbi:MAG: RHS repeat protein, partial [Sphingomonas bacterium]|nr:RHS repeat protein [Sphingomonas bacterium]